MTEVTSTPQPKGSPARKRKLSAAESVVAQMKRRSAEEKTVEKLFKPRCEESNHHKTGHTTLTAIYPRLGGEPPQKVDISFLTPFTNLRPLFVEALLAYGATSAQSTRAEVARELKRSFFSFLSSSNQEDISPKEIDDDVMTSYRRFLLETPGVRGKPLSPNSVQTKLSTLRTVLSSLTRGPLSVTAKAIAEHVPSGPTGAHRSTDPTEVISFDYLLQIIEAAENEILAVEKRFEIGSQLIAEGRVKLQDLPTVEIRQRDDYQSLSVALAALDLAYPGVIPDLDEIIEDNFSLGRAVKEIHGQGAVSGYFYPTARDLVPFVLLLAFATVFNADTVLMLDWSSIDLNKDRVGTPAIEIVGSKNRANENLVRLLDPEAAVSSALSLKRILLVLKRITSRLQPFASSNHGDRIFLFVQQVRAKHPKSFGSIGERYFGPSTDVSWTRGLKNFINDNKLPQFTLGQLRPTILDLVQLMDGSLEAAQRVGNHKNPTTTWTFYTSSGVKKRFRERVGKILLLRERWYETNGRIDPRKLEPGQDRGAATPGFLCLDPFDSPRPNQQRGKLCKDYGGCPRCPMAGALPSDPTSVACYTALERAIYESQSSMNPRTWLERWVPVLIDLKALLALVEEPVLKESKKITITLPKVG